jgi:hypothetical protein
MRIRLTRENFQQVRRFVAVALLIDEFENLNRAQCSLQGLSLSLARAFFLSLSLLGKCGTLSVEHKTTRCFRQHISFSFLFLFSSFPLFFFQLCPRRVCERSARRCAEGLRSNCVLSLNNVTRHLIRFFAPLKLMMIAVCVHCVSMPIPVPVPRPCLSVACVCVCVLVCSTHGSVYGAHLPSVCLCFLAGENNRNASAFSALSLSLNLWIVCECVRECVCVEGL